ncbi:MAG: sulfotransferase [Proteobacteria bacterium]|nr:sulfotransferase [Pseudomonadota bacterium]MBS0463438.1 sulfotransferase [Pseudomonadota bacterium]
MNHAMPPTPARDDHLLRQARDALAKRDLQRADLLYVQYLDGARDDAVALAEYGDFCLRTERNEQATYLLWKATRLGLQSADVWAGLGHARLETSDVRGAREAFAKALALAPRHAIAAYGFAQCLQAEGDWNGAVAAFERVLSTQPGNLAVLANFANACAKAGDENRAVAAFDQVERMAPRDPDMLLEVGKFHRQRGAYQLALARLEQCARIRPREAAAWIEMARCKRSMGAIDSALTALDEADRLQRGMPAFHEEVARCLFRRGDVKGFINHLDFARSLWLNAGRIDRATSLVEELILAVPASAVAWNIKGILHEIKHETDLAEAAYRHAISLNPDLLPPHTNLANICEASNRVSEAKKEANTALRLAPADDGSNHSAIAGAHLLAARLARREADYPLALKHVAAVEASPSTAQLAMMALFERAKVLDLLGDTDRAIDCFARANASAQADPGVDDPLGNKFSRGVDYLLELVDRGWLGSWRLPPHEMESDESSPVFLLGFPRSGTTLLNTILYSHSAVQVLEEEQTFAEALVMARQMPGGYPHSISRCDGLDAQMLREKYWRAVSRRGTRRADTLLVDKFPFYLTLAGAIHVVFPHAKFLFALRHPCDAVLSCFMQDFRVNDAMANFRTLADTASLYNRTMRLWQAFRDQLPLDVHTIRYEALVEDFDGQVQGLCDFLGLPFETQLRQFSTKALDRGKINTPSYEQVSQPIYRQARGRWERYRKHLEPHLPLLQPWIERFGY